MTIQESLQMVFEVNEKVNGYREYLKNQLPRCEFMHKKDMDVIIGLLSEINKISIINIENIAKIIDDSIGYQPIMKKVLMR